MKLEDCTKEELIHFIRNDYHLHSVNEETIVRTCLWKRLSDLQNKQSETFKNTTRYLKEYHDFLKPYKSVNDIPLPEVKKGAKIERLLRKSQNEETKLEKEIKRIEKILFEE